MSALLRQAVRSFVKVPRVQRFLWHGAPFLEGVGTGFLSPDWQAEHTLGTFTTAQGEKIAMVDGVRDSVKPGWRAMFLPQQELKVPDSSAIAHRMGGWHEKVGRFARFLDSNGVGLGGKDLLEIGTFDGATASALAKAGARSVTGTDIAAYYINQTADQEVNRESVERKNQELANLRDAYRGSVGKDAAGKVKFCEDDICTSSLPDGSQDIICSWEVMEHVTDPGTAFAQMFRILRPGGVVFHEYNPFFAINGGHSLCTLDFLWGHARLSDSDFERYLDENRPGEKQLALEFFRKNLNRMTLADLDRHIRAAGFTTTSTVPWSKRSHLDLIDRQTMNQCSRNYPSVSSVDLISPIVWVLMQKPS